MNNVKQELFVDALPIPRRLVALIHRGLWPPTEREERKQLVKSLIPKDRIQVFASEEDKIYLKSPPFYTVATRVRIQGPGKFWSNFAALEGISPELAVFIGDFGLGSDSPILLDYRDERSNPAVIRLKWERQFCLSNVWVRCAKNFDEFADMLGLDHGDLISESFRP
jgi:hypothetical protein